MAFEDPGQQPQWPKVADAVIEANAWPIYPHTAGT
jgi:hypothetical protein